MKEQNESSEMSFWDHIDALRAVLLRSVCVVAGFSLFFFLIMDKFFDKVILAPCSSDFIVYRKFCELFQHLGYSPAFCNEEFNVQLINYSLNSQFFTHISTSFWLGIVFAFPVIIYIFWNFISPALYDNEKKGAGKAFMLGNGLFYLGLAVGYFSVFPITLRFFATYQVSQLIPNMISLESYMSNFLTLNFMMGVVFELPLLCWMLSNMGFIYRSFFSKYRRYAVVVLLIISALITPADPFSMIMLFIPLWILYEASAYLVKPDKDVKESVPDT